MYTLPTLCWLWGISKGNISDVFCMAIRATGVAASQQLISHLVLEAQSITQDYIRAEGDFHKERERDGYMEIERERD